MKSHFSPKSILVLCEGNHCRSPIAEGLLRKELGPGVHIESAGLAAPEGRPAHAEAIALCARDEIDISGHRSRRLTPEMALAADLILVMESRHRDWCAHLAPSARGRIQLLGHWLPAGQHEIPDPMFGSLISFPQLFIRIQACVTTWKRHLHPVRKA